MAGICKKCKRELGTNWQCNVCTAWAKNKAAAEVVRFMRTADWQDVCHLQELVTNLKKEESVRNVTDFILRYTVNNGDNFYTPNENRFEAHTQAVADYNSKWNQNRRQGPDDDRGGKVWAGPGQDDYKDDPTCCGALECEHPTHEAPHPQMQAFLELPYGYICNCCGGSMVAVIQLDAQGQVLKTLLIDCG